jgi:capsular exopolysaccharide synthesis family protein
MVWIPPGYEMTGEQPAPAQESHLWDYIWLVWRGRWLVLLCFILCTLITGVWMFRATPIYEGVAKLLLAGQPPQVVNLGKIDSADGIGMVGGNEKMISNQIQVLTSKSLARDVVEELGLQAPGEGDKGAESRQGPGWLARTFATVASLPARLRAFVSRADERKPHEGAQEGSEEAANLAMAAHVAAFQGSLSVVNTRNTEIVEVHYLDANPARCAEVANAVCDAYIKKNYENKTNTYEYAGKWIDKKLYEVKANLEKSEEELYKFGGGQDAIALAEGADRFATKVEVTRQNLRQVEQDVHDRQFELEALQKGVPGEVVKGAVSSVTDAAGIVTVSATAAVESLRAELRKCETDYALAKEKFGPGMTAVKTLKATKEQLEARIAALIAEKSDEETKRALAQTQYAFDQVTSKRDYLQTELATLTERQLTIQTQLIKYNILKREVDVNKDIYNSLLQGSREVGLTSGLTAGGVTVIERADTPRAPVFPNKRKSVLISGMLGLFLGVGLVFFRDYMDTTVHGTMDVELLGKMATLGFLPHIETRRSKKSERRVPEMLSANEPRSGFAESVRQIRTALQYSLAGHSPKTILVTSAMPSEGKTTVATNLAIAMAQNGQRTVLVDADLKKPSVHKLFGASRENGLSEILAGKVEGDLESHLFKTETENLYVLTSGTRPPNPVDLLDSAVMRRLLTTLAAHFDHVVLDSTPTLDLADTGVLFPHVDGVVVVVKPGKTPRATLVRMRQLVTGLGGHVLGVVLNNRKDRSPQHYGGHYGYGYGYGHGYGYGYGHEYGYGHHYGEKEAAAEEVETSGLVLPPPKA